MRHAVAVPHVQEDEVDGVIPSRALPLKKIALTITERDSLNANRCPTRKCDSRQSQHTEGRCLPAPHVSHNNIVSPTLGGRPPAPQVADYNIVATMIWLQPRLD
jgi:hypothetical protein